MAKNISEFKKCANCGACYNACPTGAITVSGSGYYYLPQVDSARCTGCGRCVSVCPVNSPQRVQALQAGYAGYVPNNAVLLQSSSGGAFYALAQNVLKNGGVVFGAAFAQNQESVAFCSTNEQPLQKILKSKYVESSVNFSFQQIKQQLTAGRQVLFCGTPCQAAGLKRYLNRNYENLLVCDFSCGGLVSHKIFKDYLQWLEEKYGAKAATVDFRPKSFGWNAHALKVNFTNGRQYLQLATLDPYYRGFLKSLTKRDYCYECDFADNHYADIILADFWLHKKLSSLENGNKGLSLILTNSKKGQQAVQQLAGCMQLTPLPLEKAAYNIKSGHQSQQAIVRHQSFMAALEKTNYNAAVNQFDPLPLHYKIKQQVRKWVKKVK